MAYSFPVFLNSASRTWKHIKNTRMKPSRESTREGALIKPFHLKSCYLPEVSSAQNGKVFEIVHLHPFVEKTHTELVNKSVALFLIFTVFAVRSEEVQYFRADTGWSSLPSDWLRHDCRDKDWNILLSHFNLIFLHHYYGEKCYYSIITLINKKLYPFMTIHAAL